MSVAAVMFMVLTMGGVIGLNVLCLMTWARGAKSDARNAQRAAASAEPAGPSDE